MRVTPDLRYEKREKSWRNSATKISLYFTVYRSKTKAAAMGGRKTAITTIQ